MQLSGDHAEEITTLGFATLRKFAGAQSVRLSGVPLSGEHCICDDDLNSPQPLVMSDDSLTAGEQSAPDPSDTS